MSTAKAARYHGVIPPMVTPLTASQTLDEHGLDKLITHILRGKVHGLFILGTTGEGPSLSYALRRELIKKTCQFVQGRIPIMVGVSDTSMNETLALARWSADHGADAVVIAPSYYFNVSQSELLEYYQHLQRQLPLPFLMYNMPQLTKLNIGLEIVRHSLAWTNCLGIKDSSGDLVYFKKLLAARADHSCYSVFMGSEMLLVESILAGGDGAVCGGANLFPSLFVQAYNEAAKNQWDKARQSQKKINSLDSDLYNMNAYASAIKSIKGALRSREICEETMAWPFSSLSLEEISTIKRIMSNFWPDLNDSSQVNSLTLSDSN